MSTSPVQLTTAALRKMEWDYDFVQRHIPNTNRRKYGPQKTIAIDYMNFADIMAVKAGVPGTIAIQCCGLDVSQHMDRYASNEKRGQRKLVIKDRIRNFIDGTGNRFQVWSWTKISGSWRVTVYQYLWVETAEGETKIDFYEVQHDGLPNLEVWELQGHRA